MIRFFKNDIYTDPGDPIRIIYSPVVQKNGDIILEVSGKEDFQAYIQSFRESTDMAYIFASVNAGDMSVLNKVQGAYGDFTKMPSTYAEFLQMQIDAKNTFDKLPHEIKMKFDNDVNKFMVNAGDAEWLEKLGVKIIDNTDPDNIEPKVSSEAAEERS